MRGGENNCAQHRSKGTTLDTDEGKQHPRCFAKAKRTTQEKMKKVLLGERFEHFSSTWSARNSDQRIKKLQKTKNKE